MRDRKKTQWVKERAKETVNMQQLMGREIEEVTSRKSGSASSAFALHTYALFNTK